MKPTIVGLSTLAIMLGIGAFTHQWARVDHWMLTFSIIACVLALVFTGGVGNAGRIGRAGGWPEDSFMKKQFRRVSLILFMVGVPNLVAAAWLYYATHP